MPVYWEPADRLLDAASHEDYRVIAIDEAGDRMPWEVDLTGPRILVAGGESGGIPPRVLARCHDRVCVPMSGFIPCYNLQAAVSAVAVERLRQIRCAPPTGAGISTPGSGGGST
jgi:tRNA(Leu) C34 or U34 (ribose-2'-O)-methylase TrmL